MSLDENIKLDSVQINNELFYRIANVDAMRPFFMSIVSDSNHWMFISSNGGLTAGRKNADYALFPYYTDDKITESADITGSKSIFKIVKDKKVCIWEPFSERFFGMYSTTRNLYKNYFGNKIIFEEINHDLQLVFKYQWSFSNVYGFVKTSTLINTSADKQTVTILDGIQNIVPYGVGSDLQTKVSIARHCQRVEASPLIFDHHLNIFRLCFNINPRQICPRVFAHIGQRLLNNAQQL